MQPETYIAYSRDKPDSVFALFYCEHGIDLHGWHIEAHELYFSAAFFMAEKFYADQPLHLYRSLLDDVYGPWAIDCPPIRDSIRCPLPEEVCHDMERIQSRFVEEWLTFCENPYAAAEHSTPLQVRIQKKKRNRLHQEGSLAVYTTPGVDLNVVQVLRKYWRLSEKVSAL